MGEGKEASEQPPGETHAVAHGVAESSRILRNRHRGLVVWLTGLSASGKSTLAMGAEKRLFEKGRQAYVLDGDNIRRGLSRDLGFSSKDRSENIRRIGEVAALFADAGVVVLTALISPYRADRERARLAAGERFVEVYVQAGLDTCERRDPKGLYKKARAGLVSDFTGVSSPYEPPIAPDLIVNTEGQSITESLDQLVSFIEARVSLGAASKTRLGDN